MKNSIGHCLGCSVDQRKADIEGQLRRMYRCSISADGVIMPAKVVAAQAPAVAFSVPDEMKVGLLAPDTDFVAPTTTPTMPTATAPVDQAPAVTSQTSPGSAIKDFVKKQPLIAGGLALGLLYFLTKK